MTTGSDAEHGGGGAEMCARLTAFVDGRESDGLTGITGHVCDQ